MTAAGFIISQRRLSANSSSSSSGYQAYISSVNAEPFLDGTSAVYVEQLYENWLQDPATVHKVRRATSNSNIWQADSRHFIESRSYGEPSAICEISPCYLPVNAGERAPL